MGFQKKQNTHTHKVQKYKSKIDESCKTWVFKKTAHTPKKVQSYKIK